MLLQHNVILCEMIEIALPPNDTQMLGIISLSSCDEDYIYRESIIWIISTLCIESFIDMRAAGCTCHQIIIELIDVTRQCHCVEHNNTKSCYSRHMLQKEKIFLLCWRVIFSKYYVFEWKGLGDENILQRTHEHSLTPSSSPSLMLTYRLLCHQGLTLNWELRIFQWKCQFLFHKFYASSRYDFVDMGKCWFISFLVQLHAAGNPISPNIRTEECSMLGINWFMWLFMTEDLNSLCLSSSG